MFNAPTIPFKKNADVRQSPPVMPQSGILVSDETEDWTLLYKRVFFLSHGIPWNPRSLNAGNPYLLMTLESRFKLWRCWGWDVDFKLQRRRLEILLRLVLSISYLAPVLIFYEFL